jgi:hypothetical protein
MTRHKASVTKNGILIHGNPADIPIRKGMHLVFDEDFSSFRINDFSSFIVNKPFKNIESPNKIHIFENCFDFSQGDYVDIYYDQYEFFGYDKVLSKEGDIYKNQSFSLESNLEFGGGKTILYVDKITEDSIELAISEKGAYPIAPNQDLSFIAENGARIKIDHFYRKSNVKNYQSNVVKNIIYNDKFIILELVNDIPKNVSEGFAITNKLLVKTDKDLHGINKHDKFFYVIANKLPYLNLPLPQIEDEVGAKMFEDILMKIDKKFSEIDVLLQEIKNKL